MLQHRDGTELEDMYLIDAHTGKIVGMQTNSTSERKVDYNRSNDYIKQREYLLSITKYKKQGYSEANSQLKALDELKLKYEFEYKER